MRKEEFGTGNGEGEKADGKCQVADDRGQMADDECQLAHDECQVAEGELQVAGGELKMGDERCEVEVGSCNDGQSSEPMTEGSSGPIVGHDSQRDNEDVMDWTVSKSFTKVCIAAGQPGQGDGVGQCLPDDVTTPQKCQTKPIWKSKQIMESQELKSETARAEGRETKPKFQGGDEEKAEVARWPTGSAEWPATGGQ